MVQQLILPSGHHCTVSMAVPFDRKHTDPAEDGRTAKLESDVSILLSRKIISKRQFLPYLILCSYEIELRDDKLKYQVSLMAHSCEEASC